MQSTSAWCAGYAIKRSAEDKPICSARCLLRTERYRLIYSRSHLGVTLADNALFSQRRGRYISRLRGHYSVMNQATDEITAVALQQVPARVSKIGGTATRKHKYHRATNACLRCRARKVRCDATPHGIPCSNCRTDEECCEVPTRRKNARQVDFPSTIP